MSAESAGTSTNPSWLQHQYDTAAQQFEAARLGTWLIIAQGILFFSVLFVAYGVFRVWYPEAFMAGSLQLNKWLGAANTLVILTSSLTMALATRGAQLGDRGAVVRFLGITIACAVAFVLLLGMQHGGATSHGLVMGARWNPGALVGIDGPVAHMNLFFAVFFAMTGLMVLHVIGGIVALVRVLLRANKGDFSKAYWSPVDAVGLYWHFLSLVWLVAFPLLYLI